MNPDPQADPAAQHHAFADCLQRILNGENLDAVLDAYPQWEAEFRPLLSAALAARTLRPDRAPKAAQARSRALFLRRAAELTRPTPGSPLRRSPKIRFFPFRLAALQASLVALVVLLGLLLGGISTVAASSGSIPGDRLYPVKIFSEQTRLFLTKDPSRKLKLQVTYDQTRVAEVDALIREARSLNVNFAGGLRQINQMEWMVGDIRVLVAPGTQLSGDIRDGYYVGVDGVLLPEGVVIATRIWARQHEISGELQQISPQEWIVSGLSLLITAETRIEGLPLSGARLVAAIVLRADNSLEARSIRIVSTPPQLPTEAPSLTPLPSATQILPPTRTPRPEATQAPEDTDPPKPSETPKPTKTKDSGGDDDGDDDDDHETIGPSKTPRPSKTPKPTKTPEPTHDDDDDNDNGGDDDNDNDDGDDNDNDGGGDDDDNDNENEDNDNEEDNDNAGGDDPTPTSTPTPTPTPD